MVVRVSIGKATLVDFESDAGHSGTAFGLKRLLAQVGCRTEEGDVVEITVVKAKRVAAKPSIRHCGAVDGRHVCTRLLRHKGDHRDERSEHDWARGVVAGGMKKSESEKIEKARRRA